jgi:flagellar biosynthesis/type III secretory pathway M-ring protein FliF/YscJ
MTLSPTSSTILFFVLPLSATMTIFYYWTLHALEMTTKTLISHRQPVKLRMYKHLQLILFGSVVVLMIFFVVNSLFFAERNNIDWMPTHWKYKWILMDGWLNILYFFVFVSILWLWRPTRNNERYGLQQLQSDEYEDAVDLQEMGEMNSDGEIDNKETVWEEEDDVMQWAEQKFGFESDEEL